MKNAILAFVVCSMLLLVGCEVWQDIKPGDNLPAKTKEGKNTFGCLINKKLFLPETTLFGNVSPLNCYYYPSATDRFRAGSLFIQGIDARYSLPIAGDVAIQKMDVFKTGKYPLQSQSCSTNYQCDQTFYYNSDEYTTYSAHSGELNLTRLDTINKIVSGTFEFNATNPEGKTVRVTAGRFDVKYKN